jgi:hypothetical protein
VARPVMRGASRTIGIRLTAGLITVATWLLFGWAAGWSYLGGPNGAGAYGVAPYIALGVLAVLAGWRADPVAAWLIYLGGIIGATTVAWAPVPSERRLVLTPTCGRVTTRRSSSSPQRSQLSPASSSCGAATGWVVKPDGKPPVSGRA